MNDIDQTTMDKVSPAEWRRRYHLHIILESTKGGYTAQMTADYLNKMRYRTVRGVPYTRANVARIIARENNRGKRR